MLSSLSDVYLHQIHDMRSACVQSRKVTAELHSAAASADLQAALKAGVTGIEDGIATLDAMLKRLGSAPDDRVTCKAMAGMVEEARREALEASYGDEDVRDAVIITQYQRMAHYAIAGYGCLRAFARRLGHAEDEEALTTALQASRSGDETMTEIATDGVNRDAA